MKMRIAGILIAFLIFSAVMTNRLYAGALEDINKDIKIGDCVVCVRGTEDLIVKDKECGELRKWERTAEGFVTDIQDKEVTIKLENIADRHYIKKYFLWVVDTSILGAPRYRKGDFYKCNRPEIKEKEGACAVTKIYFDIRKVSCE